MSRDVPWKNVAVEAAAVVASILLAFAIDASWDARRERIAEGAALEALHAEMQRNRRALVERIETNDGALEGASAFLRLTESEIRATGPEELWSIAVDLWAPYTFDPELSAVVTFLERGRPSSEYVSTVRRAVVEWDRSWLDVGEESAVLWETSREVLALMTTHLADIVPEEGAAPRLTLLRQDIPSRMVSIRNDEAVIAASIAKFNLQGIYTNELRFLLDKTDEILRLIAEG